MQVELILLLNKCDIFARKLARGVSMKRYITTYGDRTNDMPTASNCASSLRACKYNWGRTHHIIRNMQTSVIISGKSHENILLSVVESTLSSRRQLYAQFSLCRFTCLNVMVLFLLSSYWAGYTRYRRSCSG